MSAFRLGDRNVEIAGVQHRLRFTVSSLAEMASVFEAECPKALAAHLRKATVAQWNLILRCVAVPPPIEVVGQDTLSKIMPELSALIREGLRA